MPNVIYGPSLLTDFDIFLFKQGKHYTLYEKLGSHPMVWEGVSGTHFAVWAPNAKSVSVIGDFNEWNLDAHPLTFRLDSSGIWEGFIPNVGTGALYKYHIVSNFWDYRVDKADPFAVLNERPPYTASIVHDLEYTWHDDEWMRNAKVKNSLDQPMSIYEVHLGSWKKVASENHRFLTYRELANELVEYVVDMGFTHVEFLPIMEHPFYGSWGYQPVGYFSSTRRYGDPQEFMYLIDQLHQRGIGVLLDWVPAHFPSDMHGLSFFDGSHLFEHQDPKKSMHPQWGTLMFNYGRNEVQSFLISSAFFWLDKYHADGMRVDAVASMLYLDYAKSEGEWEPNAFGGRENLEAVEFLKNLNTAVYRHFPHIQMIAEESSAWPMVSRPVDMGGLGFGMKWNMGWMHDTLKYMEKDPIHRKYHHGDLIFSRLYFQSENYMLCLSHDEVVHKKRSLLEKMPGDRWQKFANLRLLYGYMFSHSGKKLIFMGQEFAQPNEWQHDLSLEWHLLEDSFHSGVKKWYKDLNHFYQNEPALYQWDYVDTGFEWVDFQDAENSTLGFIRKCGITDHLVLAVCNFTPVPRYHYRFGVPIQGTWEEVLNSDATVYGGSGIGNQGAICAEEVPMHGRQYSLSMTLPPLSAVFFRRANESQISQPPPSAL